MSKHYIELSDTQEKRLQELAKEKMQTAEEVLLEIADLLLSPVHTMEEEDIKQGYEEWAKTYLSWSESGKE